MFEKLVDANTIRIICVCKTRRSLRQDQMTMVMMCLTAV